jgi:hypothetical protein
VTHWYNNSLLLLLHQLQLQHCDAASVSQTSLRQTTDKYSSKERRLSFQTVQLLQQH